MEQSGSASSRSASEFRQAAGDFIRFLRALAEAWLEPKAWGAREVLAHEVFWVENYAAQVKDLLAGRLPSPPAGSFEDLNVRAVAESRGERVSDLLERFETACDWLVETSQKHDPAMIVFTLKAGSAYRRSLAGYFEGEAGHIRSHQARLESQITRAYLADVARLAGAVVAFCQFIEGLPASRMRAQDWGPKEVLAHLVYWHQNYIDQIEAMQAGQPVKAPRGRVKERNARAAAACQDVPVGRLLARFRALDARLRQAASTLDPQMFVLTGQTTPQTLDGIVEACARHVEGHLRALKKDA